MERHVRDIPEMFTEMMWTMRICGVKEDSRNGEVLALDEPLLISVEQPWDRVLVEPTRNCNPFFHVAEAVWMLAGEQSVGWISHFNKRFVEYADYGGDIWGAYGHRWRKKFEVDQLLSVRDMLKDDPTTRRAVLGMWSPWHDLGTVHNDLPCNTNVYFRVLNNTLQMTVCNRSNDVIWGMCGANAVHMTILHELLARSIGVDQGMYRVMTNNAHVYTDLPDVKKMLNTKVAMRIHAMPLPLLAKGETMDTFLCDCERLVGKRDGVVTNYWLRNVATPMIGIYKKKGDYTPRNVMCPQWRRAVMEWIDQNRSYK